MKKSKIVFIILFVVAFLAVSYFTYGVIKKRYLGPKRGDIETNNGETQNQNAEQTGEQADNPENTGQENNTSENNLPASENGRPNIVNADCDNNCSKFKDNPDNLKYCQEVCGDRPVSSKESEGQCENLTGLEKDGCWRDLAVSKKDIDFCEKISDSKLKTVCRNRVAEEILN